MDARGDPKPRIKPYGLADRTGQDQTTLTPPDHHLVPPHNTRKSAHCFFFPFPTCTAQHMCLSPLVFTSATNLANSSETRARVMDILDQSIRLPPLLHNLEFIPCILSLFLYACICETCLLEHLFLCHCNFHE